MNEKDSRLNDRLISGISRLSGILSEPDLIEPGSVPGILKDEAQLRHDAEQRSRKFLYAVHMVSRELRSNTEAYLGICSSFPQDVAAHNEKIARERAADIGGLINPVEGRDLDIQQLASIAADVRTRLVLAGAGTGKTTTIVGLVKYLILSGKAAPGEILALSFTNASVDELKDRIRKETGQRVETSTFHRLGLKVIASSEGKVPKISNIELSDFIAEEISRRKTDGRYMRLLNEYLIYDFDSQKDESAFSSSSEYMHYLKENPLITLKGEKVKSFGEADIANFLAVNGISYRYEASYEKDTNDAEHGQYHPDFHLTGTNIYIEYFGIDRDGNVAGFMTDKDPRASEEYCEGIRWKREVHRANGTRLVELYAYDRSEGTLQSLLEKKLRKLNVQFRPSPPEKVFEDMQRSDKWKLSSAVSSFTTVLTLIKGTGKPWDDAYPRGESLSDRRRMKRLGEVLRPLYDAYQKTLSDNNEIDFEDMLNMASKCIWDGKYRHPYKYVVVDEYQDLSRSRFRLLRSMRRDRDYRLYCVGDDWQSIYRFNGSDVSYILDFEKYWGPSAVCRIETTYRFCGELLKLSSEFVCRNERQIAKQLKGAGTFDCPVRSITAPTDSAMRYRIGEALRQLPVSASVLFLGRYNHDVTVLENGGFSWKPDIGGRTTSVFYSPRRDLVMKFMTIHGSKGLQADYVISLNNKTGRYGFPGNRDEPPAIGLLLESGDTQHDEERRLFYVSMTRARKCLYLASFDGRQSVFFREIFRISASREEEIYCPICRGRLVLRKGKYGMFLGCENYRTFGCKFTRNIETDDNSRSGRGRHMERRRKPGSSEVRPSGIFIPGSGTRKKKLSDVRTMLSAEG